MKNMSLVFIYYLSNYYNMYKVQVQMKKQLIIRNKYKIFVYLKDNNLILIFFIKDLIMV